MKQPLIIVGIFAVVVALLLAVYATTREPVEVVEQRQTAPAPAQQTQQTPQTPSPTQSNPFAQQPAPQSQPRADESFPPQPAAPPPRPQTAPAQNNDTQDPPVGFGPAPAQ